ncbi:MAG: cell division protein ZapA [Proteobacteria bacterium]|nr:cell division protein ZapA [Pseudomonadota bacterium]
MSKDTSPINVTILDKEYLINCEEDEREVLRSAVDYLNQKMGEMKSSGGVIGAERIAVMTALNITNELLAYKKENQDYTSKIDSTLKRLQSKINDALVRDTQLDRVDVENTVPKADRI